MCADFFNSPGYAHNSLEMLREIVRKILASPALFVDPLVFRHLIPHPFTSWNLLLTNNLLLQLR